MARSHFADILFFVDWETFLFRAPAGNEVSLKKRESDTIRGIATKKAMECVFMGGLLLIQKARKGRRQRFEGTHGIKRGAVYLVTEKESIRV